jgi:hypothetical protein
MDKDMETWTRTGDMVEDMETWTRTGNDETGVTEYYQQAVDCQYSIYGSRWSVRTFSSGMKKKRRIYATCIV